MPEGAVGVAAHGAVRAACVEGEGEAACAAPTQRGMSKRQRRKQRIKSARASEPTQ